MCWHTEVCVFGWGDGYGVIQIFVPTKMVELAPRLETDHRAYDASWIEAIPEDPFDATLTEAKVRICSPKPLSLFGLMLGV